MCLGRARRNLLPFAVIRRTPPAFSPEKRQHLQPASGLAPYGGPWDRRRAAHLVRRTSFGAIKREVDRALNDGSATAAVARLTAAAQGDPLPEAPSWYSRNGSTGTEEIYDLQRTWLEAMRNKGFIEKMTLFWHNHLVTQWTANQGKASNSVGHLTYDYYKLLRFHALGNFRTLVYNIGTNPAMLIYLDGFVNEKGQANENYGRELLELFTMGQYGPDGSENYTEQDIKEIARALTGWDVNNSNRATFDPARHDRTSKTIMGQTDLFDYDGVIDLIFEVRASQIAHYVCRKLYSFFVQPVPDEAVVGRVGAGLSGEQLRDCARGRGTPEQHPFLRRDLYRWAHQEPRRANDRSLARGRGDTQPGFARQPARDAHAHSAQPGTV